MFRFGIVFTKYINCLCASLLCTGPAWALTEITQEGEVKIDVTPSRKHEEKRKKREEKLRSKEDKRALRTESKSKKVPATKSDTVQPLKVESGPQHTDDSATPESKTDGKTDVESENKTDVKVDVKSESKTAVKADVKSESKTDVKADIKSESKTETRPETKLETKSEITPATYRVDYDIRPLKGKLDHIPVLNSNSPEIVPASGILLSTLDPQQMKHPEAHLNYPIKGPFAIFFHHINKQEERGARKVLTVSLLVYNSASSKATLTLNSLASFVSQPDAPVISLPPIVEDDQGKVYAGQGDRLTSEYVRGKAILDEPFVLNIAPRSYAVLTELPIKVYGPVSTLNGRSYYAVGQTSKPLQFALLASFSAPDPEAENEIWHPEGARENMEALKNKSITGGDGAKNESLGTLVKMAEESGLAGPREGDKRAPTPPGSKEAIVYGRVSGVQSGAKYTASRNLNLQTGKSLAVAYPISALEQGTFGTGEVQTAPLVKRYESSAYAAHGNYCVRYQIDLKFSNKGKKSRLVDLALSTPIKSDKPDKSLAYFKEQDKHTFFRGLIKVIEADSHGKLGKGTVHYYHTLSHRGEKVPPFTRLEIEAASSKSVRVELYYTPDATPPQVLTVDSAAN